MKCRCGSGKKQNKCCGDKKPRVDAIGFRIEKDAVITGVEIGPGGTMAPIFEDPEMTFESTSAVRFYERAKKPKFLSRTPVGADYRSINDSRYISKRYPILVGVDTNTKTIEGNIVSVAAIAKGTFPVSQRADGFPMKIDLIEFRRVLGIPTNQENFFWHDALARLIPEYGIVPTQDIGLVVDSDLGNIDAYNKRELPYYNGEYLPAYVDMLYATADVNEPHPLNQLIIFCEKAAARALKEIELDIKSGGLRTGIKPNSGQLKEI